jgi:hypothetical protein
LVVRAGTILFEASKCTNKGHVLEKVLLAGVIL